METENIYARKWRKNIGLHIEHYYIHREVQHIGLSRYINLYLLTVLTVHLLLIGLLNGRVITSPLLVLTLPFKKFWHLFLVFYITICYDFNYCPGGFQSFGALTLWTVHLISVLFLPISNVHLLFIFWVYRSFGSVLWNPLPL